LVKEKEATRARDALNKQRRALPVVQVDKPYEFEGPDDRKISLVDMFEGRRQLIVYHFMFDPNWDEGCSACSLFADNIGHLSHPHSREMSFAVVSRAPTSKIEPFRARMGWAFPWYSSVKSDFNYDFNVTLDETIRPLQYNYMSEAETKRLGAQFTGHFSCELHGVSVFLRDGNTVYHSYSSYARGPELLIGTYNYLDLTPLGRQEVGTGIGMFRHHDKFET